MKSSFIPLVAMFFATAAVADADAVFGTPVLVPDVGRNAFALAIDGSTLYCGAGDTLHVFDVSDPVAPRPVAKLGGFSGFRQMAVDGGLLAISARGSGAWLVDVSDRTAPRLLSHYETVEQATGIDIAGSLMVVGERSTGVEFVDISDPARPQHIRMVKTQEAQSCRYRDGYVFTGDWHSALVNVIDARDFSRLRIVGAAEMQGLGDGFDLHGNLLYASTGHHRRRGPVEDANHPDNFGKGHGMEIWDVADPTAPKFLSRLDFPAFWRHGDDWWSSRASGNGWVFCGDTHNGVFAVDARDPRAPRVADRFVDPDPKFPDEPSRCINAIALGDGAVYATTGSGLWAIPCAQARFRAPERGRLLPPDRFVWRDPYATPSDSHFAAWLPPERGPVHSAAAHGGFYYAGCGYAGAYVIDARTLKTVGRIPCAYARDVVVRDGMLYVAQGDDGLGIYALDDPARPREVRRIRDFGRGIRHCEWVYVPTSRWAICHARRNSGRWQFLDLSKDPAEYVCEASGMDWVRPFADELVGGKWLAYARTHRFLQWFDLSGDRPVCLDTEDPAATGPMPRRTNYIKSASCCTPISGDRLLVANSGEFFLLDPAQDRNADGTPWPAFRYANTDTPRPSGMCSWDGANRVALCLTSGKTIQMADFADATRPNLLWEEKTLGCPENGVFDDAGHLLVPCGYQGLLVEKRMERPDELARFPKLAEPQPIALGPLEWKCRDAGLRREGDTLFVDVAKEGAATTSARATAKLDLAARRGRYLRFSIRARGRDIGKPSKRYLGLKFILRVDTADGNRRWVGAGNRMGDWEDTLTFSCRLPDREISGTELFLGLEQAPGHVEFDLSSLRVEDLGPAGQRYNQDFRVAYPRRVRQQGAHRGVMLSTRLENISEDDFVTLEKWGANLARYQIAKDWKTVGGWESNDDFDAYLNGALDILERNVLPWADRHGVKIVLDLHATPGARNGQEENRMFYEERYAKHFVRVWRRIAERFNGDRRIYGFDLVNEPQQVGPAPYPILHLQRAAAMAIRAVDPDATIIVPANGYGSPSGFASLSPMRLDNVVYTTHCYDPMGFTHQGTSDKKRDNLAHYPNPEKGWDKEFIRQKLAPVLEFSRKHNARILVGEFSAITWAPGADQYIRDCIELFEEYGWDWCYHAFREWDGWSVEKEWKGLEPKTHRDLYEPSDDNPRKRALLEGLSGCIGPK